MTGSKVVVIIVTDPKNSGTSIQVTPQLVEVLRARHSAGSVHTEVEVTWQQTFMLMLLWYLSNRSIDLSIYLSIYYLSICLSVYLYRWLGILVVGVLGCSHADRPEAHHSLQQLPVRAGVVLATAEKHGLAGCNGEQVPRLLFGL